MKEISTNENKILFFIDTECTDFSRIPMALLSGTPQFRQGYVPGTRFHRDSGLRLAVRKKPAGRASICGAFDNYLDFVTWPEVGCRIAGPANEPESPLELIVGSKASDFAKRDFVLSEKKAMRALASSGFTLDGLYSTLVAARTPQIVRRATFI